MRRWHNDLTSLPSKCHNGHYTIYLAVHFPHHTPPRRPLENSQFECYFFSCVNKLRRSILLCYQNSVILFSWKSYMSVWSSSSPMGNFVNFFVLRISQEVNNTCLSVNIFHLYEARSNSKKNKAISKIISCDDDDCKFYTIALLWVRPFWQLLSLTLSLSHIIT